MKTYTFKVVYVHPEILEKDKIFNVQISAINLTPGDGNRFGDLESSQIPFKTLSDAERKLKEFLMQIRHGSFILVHQGSLKRPR